MPFLSASTRLVNSLNCTLQRRTNQTEGPNKKTHGTDASCETFPTRIRSASRRCLTVWLLILFYPFDYLPHTPCNTLLTQSIPRAFLYLCENFPFYAISISLMFTINDLRPQTRYNKRHDSMPKNAGRQCRESKTNKTPDGDIWLKTPKNLCRDTEKLVSYQTASSLAVDQFSRFKSAIAILGLT